jgi:hypothetical protein
VCLLSFACQQPAWFPLLFTVHGKEEEEEGKQRA